jgi:hypothetical protein
MESGSGGANPGPVRIPWWGWVLGILFAVIFIRSGVKTILEPTFYYRGSQLRADPDIAWAMGLSGIALGLAIPLVLLLTYRRHRRGG